MKLSCTINGAPGEIELERGALIEAARCVAGGLSRAEAAVFLGVSGQTVWRRANLPARDPRRIRRTTYNTYPVVELERHLQAEMQK